MHDGTSHRSHLSLATRILLIYILLTNSPFRFVNSFNFVPNCIKSETLKEQTNLNSNTKSSHNKLASTDTQNNNSIIKESNLLNVNYNRRRKILNHCVISAFSMIAPANSLAAAPSTESIRKAASNIPGYGVPDVYYPPFFLGKWVATRSTISSSTNNNSSNDNVDIAKYPMRFLSNEDNLIISDRGYNLKSELQNDNKSSQGTINAVQWESSNPNVITVQYANGSFLENKVTKRFVEDNTPDYFLSSEFLRISQIPTNGMPTIAAERVLTKWRKRPLGSDDDYVIEGMELVYDPTDVSSSSSSSGKLISKSLIRLEREASSR